MSALIRSIFTAVIFTLIAGTIHAETTFVPPTEAVPPFRRDKLPIDTDAMVSLSQTMTLLSRSASMDEAPQRRAAAQALALAIALDPVNSSARDILSSIAEGKSLRDPDPNDLNRAKTQVWQLNNWLATPEAGNDGNLLADLLGDTAAALDPDHPSASKWSDSGERGKWNGWVAPVTAFEKRKIVEKPVIAKTDPDPLEPAPDDNKLSSELKSSSASIKAVLYDYQPGTDTFIFGPVTVSMEAHARAEEKEGDEDKDEDSDEDSDEEKQENGDGNGGYSGENLRMNVTCHEAVRWEVSEKVSTPIMRALAVLHGVKMSLLPKVDIRINTGKAGTYSFRRNGDDMTGPGFILANSALTGIAPDAYFIGNLDRKGEILELPDHFWKKLSTLMDEPGGRLVVPAAAEEYLTALLAMEKPEFLMKFEVLLASTPQEAVRLCAMKPDAELAAILAKFKEIKDKSDTAALGSYLANVHVRKRLVEISQAAPYHLSAKLLALQGAGNRPRAVEKKILAAEIFAAIDPLDAYSEMDIWELSKEKVAAMEKALEESRERLGQIERYAEMRDRELLKGPEDVIADLRAMIRIVRDRREAWEKVDDVSRSHRAFRDANRDLRRDLALLTGDRLPKDE